MRKHAQSTWHIVILVKYYFLSFKYLQGYVISQHEIMQVTLFLLDITILLSLIKLKSTGKNKDRRYTEADERKRWV